MNLIRFLRSVEWSAVVALLLSIAAVIAAVTTQDIALTIALTGAALTFATLLRSSNAGR
jgi:hypothetical protein